MLIEGRSKERLAAGETQCASSLSSAPSYQHLRQRHCQRTAIFSFCGRSTGDESLAEISFTAFQMGFEAQSTMASDFTSPRSEMPLQAAAFGQ
jgi:hypothetical protein